MTWETVERKAFPVNPELQNHVSQDGEHDYSATIVSFMGECQLQSRWLKEKLLLQIQSINIVSPNVTNMIVVPITKKIEIISSIQVCLIS